MNEGDEFENEEYNSGPFCIHWNNLYDCENICSRCGYECRHHEEGRDGVCEEFQNG